VRELLAGQCVTAFGVEALTRVPFPTTTGDVEARCLDVLETAHLVGQGTLPDFATVEDIRPSLKLVEKGAALGATELVSVAHTTNALARLRDLVESRADEVPRLEQRVKAIADDRAWAKQVLRSFDEHGHITDDASPALAELRGRVRSLRADAGERLEDIIRGYDDSEVLRERNFSVRNDRYVLMVKAEFQSRVDGIVHDASQTGQTVFVEPKALLELGNRIKIAQAGVLEEEQRLLVALSQEVRARASTLREQLRVAGDIESLFARGAFTDRIAAGPVNVEPVGDQPGARLELLRARHPLLAWAEGTAKLEGREPDVVVPNDIRFGDKRALVITGPNAGGKTVALKTAGLCALLARAGMPVPASPDSRLPLYGAVLPIIGDQQSLADALSSFSGHLEALREVLTALEEHASGGPVLCLFDELASGTDPGQGAAIAQAVLETVVERGAYVIATTHFERLKLLGLDEGEGNPFRNASLALDEDSHTPTFRLRLDQVGTSNAMDAARRHRLPAAVIDRAEELLAPEDRGLSDALTGLAEKRAELERRVEKVEEERARVEQDRTKLRERLEEVQREADRLRREGVNAFEKELADARKVVAEAIERAQKGADARELNEKSHDLRTVEKDVEAMRSVEPAPELGEALMEVSKGDKVFVADMPGAAFEVVEVHGDEVVVANGPMRLRTPRSKLRSARAAKRERAKTVATKPKLASPASEPRTRDNTLDLRGERVHDGMAMLDAFLDRLLREGCSRGYVLHGHGTGAMKHAVREGLAQSRYVRRSGPADRDDGGDACTLVELADARL